VICRPNRPTATRPRDRVQVGRELFARRLRKLGRFSGHSSPRPPKRERRVYEIGYLVGSNAGSDLSFNRAKNLFSFLPWAGVGASARNSHQPPAPASENSRPCSCPPWARDCCGASEKMTLTKPLWPPFPRPYWPQCQCSEVCETDGSRRLRCCACGQSAERVLPAKLKVGEEACAAIERAERLMAQLAVIGFRAELDAHGALSFVNANPERRDFARMCPAAYCFALVNTALDIDPGSVAAAISRPSEKRRVARAGRDRFVADGWAEKALAHGWSERELFALPERWSRIDQCGVAWLVGERRMISATANAIAIETESGGRLSFYRRAP
jgi:hypothetical protein